jgi:hypothetical protein
MFAYAASQDWLAQACETEPNLVAIANRTVARTACMFGIQSLLSLSDQQCKRTSRT